MGSSSRSRPVVWILSESGWSSKQFVQAYSSCVVCIITFYSLTGEFFMLVILFSCQDGQINAKELQRVLTSSGISGSYQSFSLETCTVIINMLDRDYSGKMGFSEFKELWSALNQWKVIIVSVGHSWGCKV